VVKRITYRLRSKKEILAVSTKRKGTIVIQAVRVIMGCISPILFYLGLCWLFGVTESDTVSLFTYFGGIVVVFATAVIFLIIGESLIEDWVKLIAVALLVWLGRDYLSASQLAVAIGLPVGAAIRLMVRLL